MDAYIRSKQQKASTPVGKRQNDNAFSLLMNSSSSKKKTTTTTNDKISSASKNDSNKTLKTSSVQSADKRSNAPFKSRLYFVTCPAGCGKRLIDYEVNDHLDVCLTSTTRLEAAENRNNANIQQVQQESIETDYDSVYQPHAVSADSLGSVTYNPFLKSNIICHDVIGTTSDIILSKMEKQSTTITSDIRKQSYAIDDTDSPETFHVAANILEMNPIDINDDDLTLKKAPPLLTTSSHRVSDKATQQTRTHDYEYNRDVSNNHTQIKSEARISNAFNVLMSNSKPKPKRLKRTTETCSTMTHRLHLNKDLSVLLYVYNNDTTSGTNKNNDKPIMSSTNISEGGPRNDAASTIWTPDDCCWSASSRISFKHDKVDATSSGFVSATDEKKVINLIVSSSIPTRSTSETMQQQQNHRFVTHHSKLSVPVLKSVLQKSIRRRKPIPSVHVAMEILDKASEALFRRLPVIILEDSTLHPHFDLLVWLMIACSKEYVPSSRILVTVLTAIFEVASCPWYDNLHYDILSTTNNANKGDDVTEKSGNYESFQTFVEPLHRQVDDIERIKFHNQYPVTVSNHDTLVYCMFVRAEYGGMNCDVTMLRQSATTWLRRFNNGNSSSLTTSIPNSVDQRHSYSLTGSNWVTVPWTVHNSAMEQSHKRLGLVNNNTNDTTTCLFTIKCLTILDITLEGVDFHCSPVLSHIINETSNHQLDWMENVDSWYTTKPTIYNDNDKNNNSNTIAQPVGSLELYLKQCIWDYMSGINYRLPLEKYIIKIVHQQEDTVLYQQQHEQEQEQEQKAIRSQKVTTEETVKKDIWRKHFFESTRAYQLKYIQDRLSPFSHC